jgi:nucleotide-binding universal stress UspA family protein
VKAIVTGYDGTKHADHALARAAELSRALAAKLIVVSVGHPAPVAAPELMIASTMPVAPAPGALLTRHGGPASGATAPDEPDEAALLLERARRFLTTRRTQADFVAESGDPADRLLAVADERNADLIVVGCHERSFLHRLLGPGVDEQLARRANCDILLVH